MAFRIPVDHLYFEYQVCIRHCLCAKWNSTITFCVGVTVTSSGPTHRNPETDLVTANKISDYQFITAPLKTDMSGVVLRCASGLGLASARNTDLGGWYFSGNQIAVAQGCGSGFHVRSANPNKYLGIINLYPCGPLSADEEGVYSCRMMTSSFIVQTTRVGLYLSGRSKSVYMYPITSLLTILHLCTQLLQ